MSQERMKQLLDNCIRYIKFDNPEAADHLHSICGFTDEELISLGYDYLAEEKESTHQNA